jgi:hypothetical protein
LRSRSTFPSKVSAGDPDQEALAHYEQAAQRIRRQQSADCLAIPFRTRQRLERLDDEIRERRKKAQGY